ncbi:hypothetical protein BLOT_010667 [Blomia tropicalis]|nr:hypothetical protein BLOT_010667 [Blomia tropicalis]
MIPNNNVITLDLIDFRWILHNILYCSSSLVILVKNHYLLQWLTSSMSGANHQFECLAKQGRRRSQVNELKTQGNDGRNNHKLVSMVRGNRNDCGNSN